ncbi:hypothetical protein GQ600_2486 [Phytophthora cactorum]|nr:hypothetical protein GQ600_2486 [Phytophthora cactorum]
MGAVGVDAFFHQALRRDASYRKWGYTLADYFSKRFFRVYPLFALLSIALWLMPFEYKQHAHFSPGTPHYLMWTLPLEISYYFILPAFVLAVLKLGRFWWLSFVPLYVWVIHEGLYTTRDNFYRQPLSMHLPTFVAGSMAAVIFVKLEAWIKATGFKFRTLHVVAFGVVFRGLFFNWLGLSLPPSTRYIMPFTSVKLSLLIIIEMLQPSTVSQIFEWFLRYLLHVFVIFTPPIKQMTNYYDKTFAVFGLVILLATTSYYLVEYPSQLLAQRLSCVFAERKNESDTEELDDAVEKSSAMLLAKKNEEPASV